MGGKGVSLALAMRLAVGHAFWPLNPAVCGTKGALAAGALSPLARLPRCWICPAARPLVRGLCWSALRVGSTHAPCHPICIT